MHYSNPIVRLTTGFIDTINDTIVGGGGGGTGAAGTSKTAGQLGQGFWLDDSNIQYQSATPVYGGHFRYVRLAAGATAVVRGQIVFWDISVADNLYQVTTSEAGSTTGAQFRAGIVLNPNWSAGNYGVIQDVGPTYVKFANPITGTAEIGAAVYCGAFGAGAQNGLADVLGSANPTDFNDVTLMQNRYLGAAIALPVAGATSLVYLNFLNIRG